MYFFSNTARLTLSPLSRASAQAMSSAFASSRSRTRALSAAGAGMILSLVAFLLFAFGALAGWRAMLFPVYVLSPVLLATFVFLPWLTVVVLILSVQAGYLAGAVAHSTWERWSRPPPRQPPP